MMRQTFEEHIEAGYTFPENIDNATQDLLKEFFGLRHIKPHFDRFFNRSLEIYYPSYLSLLRVDPAIMDIDWFVQNYLERQIENFEHSQGQNSTSEQGSKNGTIIGTDYSTGNHSTIGTTLDVKNDIATNTKHDEEATETKTTNEGFSENNSESSNRDMKHGRTNPMSASYSASELSAMDGTLINGGGQASMEAHAENFAYPKIKNPTASEDSLAFGANSASSTNESETNADGSREYDGTETHTGNSTNNITNNVNASDTTNRNTNQTHNELDNRNITNQNRNDSNGTHREIMTGRNALPAEVISKARSLIASSNSYKWFVNVLDKNFTQHYEREDYV